jgi:hypothetical protein
MLTQKETDDKAFENVNPFIDTLSTLIENTNVAAGIKGISDQLDRIFGKA